MTAANQPTRHLPSSRLWFGLLGGAVAWLIHLLSTYAIAEFGCVSEMRHYAWMNITAVAWLIVLVSVLTLLLAVAATIVAHGNRRRLRTPTIEQTGEPPGAEAYMAGAGFIMSLLFVFIILVQSIPIFFYLRSC